MSAPAVWECFGQPGRYMCSWCGVTATKALTGVWVRLKLAQRVAGCPECAICPTGKAARVIVADPPWRFRDRLPGRGRGAAKHYSTLSTEEIGGFLASHHDELPEIAPDALLFLWRVSAMQLDALRVCAAWGFEPKAELVWVKTTRRGRWAFGMGRYTRASHETCLIAARGKAARLVRDHAIRSVFEAPAGRHSAKPAAFFELVERMAAGPYVELFARTPREGWFSHGNEIAAPRRTRRRAA